MEHEKFDAALEKEDLFSYNEERANHYAATCLKFAAIVATLIWVLNILGFFIVDKTSMNIVMPTGILLFLVPLARKRLNLKLGRGEKYFIVCCFLLGISAMSFVLTLQMIMAWTCPIVLSCHYYSPRFTRFVAAGTLLCMLVSFYIGIFVGVWDSNIMRSSAELAGVATRVEFIRVAAAAGDNIPLRALNFYYMPRAVVIVVVYLICITLSKRTHGLLSRQDEIVRESQRIGTELSIATQIQADMLPSIFPAFPERGEFDIYATMDPAREVGGDFYDFFMVDNRHLAIVMADVSGKGVPAALFMVIGKTLIKDHTLPGADLGEVFRQVNELLCEANKEGLFITAFEGVLDLATGELRFVNAGHEPAFFCPAGGSYAPRKTRPGFVLAGMEGMTFQADSVTLSPGDKLFQYTDGVTEATRSDQELYGMDRLQAVLDRNRDASPRGLLSAVKTDINAFVGEAEQFDDITMLCLEFKQYMSQKERRP